MHKRMHSGNKIEIPCLVYARSSSKRLPKKNLLQVHGKPIFQILHERLTCIFENVIFLTSDQKSDDAFCDNLKKSKINYFRGDLESTLIRTYQYLKSMNFTHFYRVCGDSPLYPIDLIMKLEYEIKKITDDNIIYTNVFPARNWPKGWSIERIPAKIVFEAIELGTLSQSDHEHLTPWVYKNAGEFGMHIYQLAQPRVNLNNIRFVIDTPEDYGNMCDMPKEWFSPEYYLEKGYREILGKVAGKQDAYIKYEMSFISRVDSSRKN